MACDNYITNNNTNELYISNNCCGANFYQKMKLNYNNPFIWLVVPYDSLVPLFTNFENINWDNVDFKKSEIKKNTFIIVVDNQVELHFVHHFFDPNCDKPKLFTDNSGSHIGYCHIWEYIYEKYKKRIELMKQTNMIPKFIIHDQQWEKIKIL